MESGSDSLHNLGRRIVCQLSFTFAAILLKAVYSDANKSLSLPPPLVKKKIGHTVTTDPEQSHKEEALDYEEELEDFGCRCSSTPDPLTFPRFRIVGGSDVRSNVKWIAYLQLQANNDADFCTGSLINAAYVLSAAHCACTKVLLCDANWPLWGWGRSSVSSA